MKIHKTKLFLLGSALSMVLFQACTDADNPIDQVNEGTTRGAVLRTISVVSGELPLGVSTAGFAVDLEIQDEENGDLVETVNVYVRFTDNTIAEGGTNFSAAEVAAGTIPRSDFTLGSRGLPQTSYIIGLEAMQNLLGLSEEQVNGGDVFRIRFELILVDGRVFSVADNTATLTGTFFASPFVYNATVVCPPIAPTSGTWLISTQDSYGDGWNGGSLSITIDDNEPIEFANSTDNGGPYPALTTDNFTFEVPSGALSIQIVYNSGSFDEEVTFQITSANGETVLDLGPEPPTGASLFDFCLDLNL